jgi:hypothetical protein
MLGISILISEWSYGIYFDASGRDDGRSRLATQVRSTRMTRMTRKGQLVQRQFHFLPHDPHLQKQTELLLFFVVSGFFRVIRVIRVKTNFSGPAENASQP